MLRWIYASFCFLSHPQVMLILYACVCARNFFVVVKLDLKVNGKSEDNQCKPDQLSLDVKNLNLKEISDEGNVKSYRAQTFTFDELAAATRNFRSDCFVGEGGFGKVYKGCIEKTNQVRQNWIP